MAKLPDNFVKAPAGTSRVTTTKPASKPADKPIGKEVRRKARRDAPPPAEATEQGAHSAHNVLVRLSPEEHQALSAACEALAAAGEIVTIENMIRQVVARWIAATRAAAAPEPTAAPEPAAPHAINAIHAIRAQLRWLAEHPFRRWRALRQALQRWTHALAS
jgi:hypothetical protein